MASLFSGIVTGNKRAKSRNHRKLNSLACRTTGNDKRRDRREREWTQELQGGGDQLNRTCIPRISIFSSIRRHGRYYSIVAIFYLFTGNSRSLKTPFRTLDFRILNVVLREIKEAGEKKRRILALRVHESASALYPSTYMVRWSIRGYLVLSIPRYTTSQELKLFV